MLNVHENNMQMCSLCNSRIPKKLARFNIVAHGMGMRYSTGYSYINNARICGKCIKETVELYNEEQIKDIINWENRITNEQLKVKNLAEEEKQKKLKFQDFEMKDGKFCMYCNLEIPEDIPFIDMKGPLEKSVCGKCMLKAYKHLPEKLYMSEELYNKTMMVHKLGK